ncbi:hypothetical protein [Carboxylicivirga sp. RSCT41]|uniref:hypothetical protein n=1 Tax=Carboxylicivirga agarovorans TaxID=3417570 RepID=UPI003D32627F
MRKKIRMYTIRRATSLFTVLLSMFCLNAFAQLPAALEKEYDQFNAQIYKAFQIMNSEPEAIAIKKVSEIKAELIKTSEKLFPKLNALPELTEKQENDFMQKTMSKPLYQDMMKLMADPVFIKKISNSPKLMAEFSELESLLDMGDNEEEEEE